MKLRELCKAKKLNNVGMTLVEMIVSFMLLAVFMVSAMQMIFSVMSVYYQEKSIEQGLQIATLVADRVTYTIEGALTDKLKGRADGAALVIADNSVTDGEGNTQYQSIISMTDRNGTEIEILVNPGGYLDIHYKEITAISGEVIFEEEHVQMDAAAYLGYHIESFRVIPAGADYNGNILKLELTVKSDRYGSYSVAEYIECFNFVETVDYGSIIVE